MSTCSILILYAILTACFSFLKGQSAKEFHINAELDEVINQRHQYYRIALDDSQLQPFLHIQTTVLDYNQPAFIYVSGTSSNPSNADRDYFSHEMNKNDIYLPQVYLKGKKTINIGIFCQKEEGCKYHISNKVKAKIEIEENDHLTFDSSVENDIYFSPIANKEGNKMLMFYTYGGHINTFKMDLRYKELIIKTNQTWENGYSSIVDLSNEKYADKNEFIIHIKTKPKTIITVGVKYIDKIQKVNPYEGVFNHIPENGYSPICYHYINLISGHNYVLNTVLFVKNALFYLKSIDTTKPDPERKIEQRYNSIIAFTYEELNSNYLCLEAIESKKNCSLTFQLIDKETIGSNQRLLMPIVNGVQQKNVLPASEVVYYRHWYYHNKAIKINLHMSQIKGNPLLYSYKCDQYPFGCDVNQSKINHLVEAGRMKLGNEINKQMVIIESDFNSLDLESASKYLTVIHCQGEQECEYTIGINFIGDSVELVEGASFNKPSDKNEVDYYTIKLFKPEDVQSIKILLESIAGNADLEVYEDPERTKLSNGISYFAGSKEIVEMKPFQEIETIKEAYYIKVLSKEKSYYSLRYRVNEVNYNDIPPGVMYTVELTKKDAIKKYSFRDRNTASNSKYVITVKGVNCRVNLNHEGKDYKAIKAVNIMVSKSKPELNPYSLKMQVESFDDGSENVNEFCIVMLSGDEQSIDFPLLLIESNFYLQQLNKDEPEDYFAIPLVYNELAHSLVIDIEFNVPAILRVTIFANGKEVISNSRISSFKKFVLNKGIELCNGVPLCPIILKLSIENIFDSVNVPYKILFKNSKKVPVFLRRNYMRNDETFPAEYRHFYSDIKLNESGEVVIKFHKGSGEVFSKIIRKEVNEEDADWNKRVKLPHKNMKDSLVYDYFQKKVSFGPKKTSQCINGCEIYIAIISDELFISEPTLTEYSIYLKSNKDTVIVPIREYVSGSCDNTNDINYYHIQLPLNSERIVVNFQSSFGTMYVNQGTTLPTSTKSDITISKGIIQYTIHASDLSKETFKKGDTFTIGVQIKEYVKHYSDYLFVFIPQTIDIVTHVEIRSEQTEYCKTNKDYGNGCYFAIELPDYQKIEFFLIYAFLSHVSNKVEIYASLVDKVNFDTNPRHFIPAESYEFNSKNSIDSRYLLISSDRLYLKKDFYAIVYVKTEEETELNLMTSFNNILKYTNLLPQKKHLYFITQGQTILFNILGHSTHKIQATNLVGKGTIKYNKDTEKKLDATIVMIPKEFEAEEEFSITAANESVYGILVLIKSYSYDSRNMEILPFNELNDIIYTSNFFPQSFFIEIPFNQFECSLNIKLSLYEKETIIDSSTDEFEIKGYIVPTEFYFEKISNPDKEPLSPVTNGVYLKQERVGFIGLTVSKSESLSKHYLYAKIQPTSSNTNTYKQIVTEVMSYSKSNFIEDFQTKKYFYSSIDSPDIKTTYLITKQFPDDRFARIEFGDCSHRLTYSIESNIPLTYKNESYVIRHENKKYGRHVIIAEFKEKTQLYFSVFARQSSSSSSTSSFPLTYVIKYTASSSVSSFIEYKIDELHINYSNSENKIMVNWKTVKDQTDKEVKATYNLKVYESKIEDFQSLKSICVLIPADQAYQLQSDNHTITKGDKTDFLSLTLIASFTDDEEEEFLMAYYMRDVDFTINKNKWIIIICISTAIVIITIGIIFYCVLIKKRCCYNEETDTNIGPLLDIDNKD